MSELLYPSHVVALSPERARGDVLAATSEILDVLVVGGGIVGAGVALEAAAAGVSVAVVEAEDWASGTSSVSSKLIHGGLRYLKSRQFGLVREALRERGALLALAPHLVNPLEFLYPLQKRLERPYVATGIALYDVLARLPGSPPPLKKARHVGIDETRALAPALDPDTLRGGFVYSDAQVDDARLVLEIVRTAASFGALLLSRARVVRLRALPDGTHSASVHLTDTDEDVTIRARSVVAATGVWTEEFAAIADVAPMRLTPSKGVHLVFPRDAIELRTALISPTKNSVLFVLPWREHWIVGTTDTPWLLPTLHPFATRQDIDYLLGELNRVLAKALSVRDIASVYVGLRPLLSQGSGPTTTMGREHAVRVPRPGFSIIAGGKYTTFRVMAHQALSAALTSAGLDATPTRSIATVGALGYVPASADKRDHDWATAL